SGNLEKIWTSFFRKIKRRFDNYGDESQNPGVDERSPTGAPCSRDFPQGRKGKPAGVLSTAPSCKLRYRTLGVTADTFYFSLRISKAAQFLRLDLVFPDFTLWGRKELP